MFGNLQVLIERRINNGRCDGLGTREDVFIHMRKLVILRKYCCYIHPIIK